MSRCKKFYKKENLSRMCQSKQLLQITNLDSLSFQVLNTPLKEFRPGEWAFKEQVNLVFYTTPTKNHTNSHLSNPISIGHPDQYIRCPENKSMSWYIRCVLNQPPPISNQELRSHCLLCLSTTKNARHSCRVQTT